MFSFGRSGQLSLLELKAVAKRFELFVDESAATFAVVRSQEPLAPEKLQALQKLLGGTVRIIEYISDVTTRQLVDKAAEALLREPGEGKLTVGISIEAYGSGASSIAPFRLAKPLKERLRTGERGVRIVTPQQGTVLNAGTLFHNKLTEVYVFLQDGVGWLGLTRTFQNVEDYTKRDFGIPNPNAVSGMLPPKLAQTMINLVDSNAVIYDPFCGNGRILLEGTLMDRPVFGSDIKEQQVNASRENLVWLGQEYDKPVNTENVWQADATKGPGREIGQDFVIVTEPYLGKPLLDKLRPDQKPFWLEDIEPIYRGFIEYWSTAAEQPKEMIMVFPRARVADGSEISVYDAVIDRLHQVGYSSEVLFCYDRPDSIVRRDLVRITRLSH
jgi:tRNA G10  N-methylase Trm11